MPDRYDYDEIQPLCEGRSANPAGCQAPARYAIERPAGKNAAGNNLVVRRFACGRHLSWLLDHMTVPGRSVTVHRLSALSGSDERG